MNEKEWVFFADIEELVAYVLPCGKALLFHQDDGDDHIVTRINDHKSACDGCG